MSPLFPIAVSVSTLLIGYAIGLLTNAHRFHRREKNLRDYAEGLLRALGQAETRGFRRGLIEGEDRGRVGGVTLGLSLRDQIDEIGDYST